MATISEKTAKALKELILINNDRTEGYKKAMDEVKDSDLKTLFSQYSSQSRENAQELRTLVPAGEDTPDRDETMLSGKFYRVWMDVKEALSAHNRKAVLQSCEYGEDIAKKAYETALENREELSSEAVATVQKQYDHLLDAHNQVKALRDSAS